MAKKPPPVVFSGRPPPPPKHHHEHCALVPSGGGVQDIQLEPFSRQADETSHKSVSFKRPCETGTSSKDYNIK